jgi:hypothetical protein
MLVGFRALVEWVGEAQPGRLHQLGLLAFISLCS